MVNRSLALSAAFVLLVPTIAAGAIFANPVEEQLVEGHTVFAVVQITGNATETHVEFAAAIAVLIQETTITRSLNRFPAVLWFNDQYLTLTPTGSGGGGSARQRYPCTGAVLAVNSGDPDPRLIGPAGFNGVTYVESYFITDPNDHSWNVDKWLVNDSFVWTVALRDYQPGYSQEDDGTCRGTVYSDRICGDAVVTYQRCRGNTYRNLPDGAPGRYVQDPGANGQPYRAVSYNAVLYFLLEDLGVPNGPKNHTHGSTDWQDDVSGCHSPPAPGSGRTWPCPNGDDGREGNSHPYNPDDFGPYRTWDGWDNHGGSDDCTGDAAPDMDCHATRLIDVYFGVAAEPILRTYRVLDVQGSTAPYHCHSEFWCGGGLGAQVPMP